MSKYTMISPQVPNVPWQERPADLKGAPVWRYNENPIIGRNPVEGVARIFNSAVMPYEGEFIGVSVQSRQTESPTFTWEEARMRSIGRLIRKKLILWTRTGKNLCLCTPMIQDL